MLQVLGCQNDTHESRGDRAYERLQVQGCASAEMESLTSRGSLVTGDSSQFISGNGFPSQGSVDDEISLGAYVAAALLELGQPLKVSIDQLSPALPYSPMPAPCYGEKAHNVDILQARNTSRAAKRETMFGETEVIPHKRQCCSTSMEQ